MKGMKWMAFSNYIYALSETLIVGSTKTLLFHCILGGFVQLHAVIYWPEAAPKVAREYPVFAVLIAFVA